MPEIGGTQEKVSYRSSGKCLVVGNSRMLWEALASCCWSAAIRPYFLATGDVMPSLRDESIRRGIPFLEAQPEKLDGYLGRFSLWTSDGSEVAGIFGLPERYFDLVLDLTDPPLLQREILPFGYFSIMDSARPLGDMVAELSAWVGEFEKPKYFAYEEDLCAHGREGGCWNCIEVCAAEAISSEDRRIRVDPWLCQGCGDCATACPSGALSYAFPRRERTLAELMEILAESPGSVVFLHPESQEVEAHPLILPHALESVAACGPEIWLALLASGAVAVRIVGEGLSRKSQKNLEAQMQWVNEILLALGYGEERVGWAGGDLGDLESISPLSFPFVRFSVLEDKREVLYLALDHLSRHAPRCPEVINLPVGAPLGSLVLDGSACTLCMACVSMCPGHALEGGSRGPQLRFIEGNCVQCGLCEAVCPEDAIRLQPRFLAKPGSRNEPRIFHEDAPFACLECGKAFASRKAIQVVLARIGDHPMFSVAENRRSLLLCEECRVRSMMR